MAPFKLPSSGKAIADITVSATVHKSRKPKFELHLKIFDLNNVPLVSGVSSIKWHLPHSLNNDHRGRTHKQTIANHRVDYGYAKVIPVRLVVDRNNRLSDCPIEFEITQEFETHGASRDEKVLLGKVSLNLAEYVAESEGILRNNRPGTAESPRTSFVADSPGGWHTRNRSSMSTKATLNSVATADSGASGPGGAPSTAGSSAASISTSAGAGVEDGVIRRYLLQDSKINSTLKISILMVQIDGERNFIAPALKSAAVFGVITGIMGGGEMSNSIENLDDDDSSISGVVGALMSTSISKGHETAEIQDVYRRALAASWACQSGELPADECIEDIFGGGDGFRSPHGSDRGSTTASSARHGMPRGSPQIGGSMAGAMQRSNWSPSSPTHSSIYEGEEEDVSPVPSRASSGGKKHCPRIIPRLGQMRRKTPAAHGVSGQASSSASHKTRYRDGDGDAGYTSSGEDAASNASGSNHHNQGDDEGEYSPGNHATLRPKDVHKFRSQPGTASASAPVLAALRFPGREDSGFSDRTVMPQMDMEASMVPRSSRGSPSSHSSHFGHRRNGSYESASRLHPNSEDHRSRRGAQPSSGRMPGGSRQNSGSGHDEQQQKPVEVNEYEVRDNFVAWQLPASGSGSMIAS
ncbi:respiratory complex assembly protein rmp1 [Ophiostoma piceae UAMH 11346]|uniref:Respiratory complex assembly protein rmp1 n=1 Tax=Ophiostoma piceae (strain UAMH 11346) TaxID=1262450 RepID=S3CUX3_OPHP1|nr:respiratory complex assembly protein rmp1 [Ophiostoma piceae UAMH 11346]